MGFFGNLFKKKAIQGKVAVEKMTNRGEMRASVAVMVAISAADGTIDQDEIEAIDSALTVDPMLAQFNQEVNIEVQHYKDVFKKIGMPRLLIEAEEAIEEIAGDSKAARRVMAYAVSIANKGGIDEHEEKMLRKIAKMLGQSYESYVDSE